MSSTVHYHQRMQAALRMQDAMVVGYLSLRIAYLVCTYLVCSQTFLTFFPPMGFGIVGPKYSRNKAMLALRGVQLYASLLSFVVGSHI